MKITIEKIDPETKVKNVQTPTKENWEANKHVFEKLGWKLVKSK
jgi:hypothetical protein